MVALVVVAVARSAARRARIARCVRWSGAGATARIARGAAPIPIAGIARRSVVPVRRRVVPAVAVGRWTVTIIVRWRASFGWLSGSGRSSAAISGPVGSAGPWTVAVLLAAGRLVARQNDRAIFDPR